jgi:glutathione-specific gamma-glutamylcyclotransferase
MTKTEKTDAPPSESIPCPPPADGNDLWVFAYGSLMWDPGFPFEEARPARLGGYHRAFCFYSTNYRGTAEKPGLVLGLDRGGSCHGIAYRVAAERVETVLAYLWEREMNTNAYLCKMLPVRMSHMDVKARAFVVNRKHAHYTGKLPLERVAELIAQGHGKRGSCRAYLENTVRHLDQMGLPDAGLHRLLDQVHAVQQKHAAAAVR